MLQASRHATSSAVITSRANPRVARVRALRRRSERDRTGLYLAEGVRVVVEAFQQGAGLEELVVAPDLLRSAVGRELVADARRRGIPCLEVSPEVFESLGSRDGPQGLLAVVRQRWTTLARADPREGLCWVALEAVQAPGNLGCILRSADAVGAAGVILLGNTTDPYDPTSVRASAGAICARQVVRTTLAELSDWTRRHGVSVVGASDAAALDYRAAAYQAPLLLLMGSEQRGLSEQHVALCDRLVSIPMLGRCDSLNLAVATAVLLYEVLDQRQRDGRRDWATGREEPTAG